MKVLTKRPTGQSIAFVDVNLQNKVPNKDVGVRLIM